MSLFTKGSLIRIDKEGLGYFQRCWKGHLINSQALVFIVSEKCSYSDF